MTQRKKSTDRYDRTNSSYINFCFRYMDLADLDILFCFRFIPFLSLLYIFSRSMFQCSAFLSASSSHTHIYIVAAIMHYFCAAFAMSASLDFWNPFLHNMHAT